MESRANPKMTELLRKIPPAVGGLEPGLREYLASGVAENVDGSIVAVSSRVGANADRSRFVDATAFEAYANKIHVGDWLSEDWEGTVFDMLAQALALGDELAGVASKTSDAPLEVAISCDPATEDVVFRFYRVRENEPPWLKNPEDVAEAVLLRRYAAEIDE